MSRPHSPTDDLQALRAVFSQDNDLTTPERAVLAVLVLHRNGETGRCDPSLSRIAGGAGVDRRTVMRALAALEDAGHVQRRAHRDGRTRTSYTAHPPTRGRESLGAESHRGQSAPALGAESHQTRGTVPPERTKERTKERTDELWAVFVAELDGDRLTLTQARRKKLAALYTEQLRDEPDALAAFRKILRAVKASDHHMSNRNYQMPESLFKNLERRETWAEKARTNGRTAKKGNPLMMTPEELHSRGLTS
jgi:hypothetical protein